MAEVEEFKDKQKELESTFNPIIHSHEIISFQVHVYDDLTFKKIEQVLEQASIENDHGDADCILIAVLSHGELGILYASDHAYKPDRLWTQFNAEKCPSLAGTLFFNNIR